MMRDFMIDCFWWVITWGLIFYVIIHFVCK